MGTLARINARRKSMRRVLEFGKEQENHFRVAFEGLSVGSAITDARNRTPDVKRQEGRIYTALAAISEETDQKFPATGEPVRALRDGALEVSLEQRELDLLIKYIETVPWLVSWQPRVQACIDWLTASPRINE
jgi:hypothetical protein